MNESPAGRVTVAAGAFRVGIHADPKNFSAYGWHDAPGLPADLELHFESASERRFTGPPTLSWREHGFSLQGEWVRGTVDLRARTGHFCLHLQPGQVLSAARLGVLEASIATLMSLVLRRGGLLLHAATIEIEGRAVVVVGESGRGKTTLCQRFPNHFLNEEYAFLAPTGPNGTWEAHWYAQERGPTTERPSVLPMGRLCLLSPRRSRTAVLAATNAEALTTLHGASLWVHGVPPALQLGGMERLLSNFAPTWLEHDLRSPHRQLIDVLRSPK